MTNPKGKRPNTAEVEILQAMESIRQGHDLDKGRPWYREMTEEELREAAKEYRRLAKRGHWPG